MPQLDVFHVVEDGIQALSLVDDLVGRDENKLRVLVDEFLNEPWAGDPVDLDALARDPFHAILPLPCMRTPPSAISIWADAKPSIAAHARWESAAATRRETFARSDVPPSSPAIGRRPGISDTCSVLPSSVRRHTCSAARRSRPE